MVLKATGIVRKIDDLGRVVLPIELRRTLGLSERDALEIYVDGERIMLKKYEPACIFCGTVERALHFKGKIVCKQCMQEMSPRAGSY
jgi:transcriptional pleiotropic regulator of transition state genes